MYIGVPQAILLTLIAMNLGIDLVMDGESKDSRYCFGASLFATGVQLGLLYWGGFFE